MHYPVMIPEVLAALSPVGGQVYVDGTFGNGGYTENILKSANCSVVGLDQDPNVLPRSKEFSEAYGERFSFVQTPFSKMSDVLAGVEIDAVILDIGVSSMQLDQAERGFSFMRSGPLDMRMQQEGPSAADAVNELSLSDLTRIFKVYGEEKRARRAAQFIVRAREGGDIVSTDQLAGIIEKALGRTGKIHPATRVFQALRIFVNDELGELYRGLCAAERLLKPGGRLIVVSFHSLEDRIVKKFLRRRSERPSGGSRHMPAELEQSSFEPSFTLESRSSTAPSDLEVEENPRSRSARMRWAIRSAAPVFDQDENLLPNAPSVHDYKWAA